MKYRQLGSSDLRVSEISYGTWLTAGVGVERETAAACLDAAFDLGINFIDTADVYGRGLSETVLGDALGARRKNVIIATKFGAAMGTGKAPEGGGSRESVINATEEALQRLKTDVIDLMQLHQSDPKVPQEETMAALNEMVQQGKIRAFGHSNFNGAQADATAKIAADRKIAPYVTAQNHYSLLTRDIEKDLVPACVAHGVGILPYFPLESGLLTGKYKRGEKPAEGTRFAAWSSRAPAVLGRYFGDDKFEKVEKLRALCDAHGATLLQMAFGWLLNKPYIVSVIAGATKPEQIEANLKAATWRPTPDVDREIDRITKSA